MSDILGIRDFFYGHYLLSFSKHLCAVNHYRSIGAATEKFANIYPLASFLVFYLAQISGGIFYSLCMNEPLLYVVGDLKFLLICLTMWSLTFHCPKDAFHSVFGKSGIACAIGVLREVERVVSVEKLTTAALNQSGSSPYAAFVITLVSINLPFHLIYFLDQLVRGVALKKHEILALSFTSRITVFDAFVYNWYLYLGQISGKYAIVDVVANIPNNKFLQLLGLSAVTLKTLLHFNQDLLVLDELLLVAPLMKLAHIFSWRNKSEQNGKTRRATSALRNVSETLVEDADVTVVEDSADETPKKRVYRTKRTASSTRRKKQ